MAARHVSETLYKGTSNMLAMVGMSLLEKRRLRDMHVFVCKCSNGSRVKEGNAEDK